MSVAPACIPASLPDPGSHQQPLHGRKLGVYWDWFNDAAPDVVDACKAALNEMCKKGAEVTLLFQLDINAFCNEHNTSLPWALLLLPGWLMTCSEQPGFSQ